MAANGMRGLVGAMRSLSVSARPVATPVVAASAVRGMATNASPSDFSTSAPTPPLSTHAIIYSRQLQIMLTVIAVPVTIHAFPTLEPTSLEQWSSKHLYIPLRRDILHRAVIFEADSTRQGTASTKTRWEVRGSRRKVRPQKGSGNARAGDRMSPIFRGGGVVFGPHPRDFSTDLPRKMYDKAWRMALSYRYRRGELVVCQDGMEMPLPEDFTALRSVGFLEAELATSYLRKQTQQLLDVHGWQRSSAGRTTFITETPRPNLFEMADVAGDQCRAMEYEDVDVKNLLEDGRLVVERSVLRRMIEEHQSDLQSKVFINGSPVGGPALGEAVVA
ncbi:hypothetical protein TD95_004987 [Thielaviopsis punctulata]|uniref:Large ribosomal subunit protein uL4m n=1 Tax=Thielaviopsis punctulata TaxID=72032 RepID=A0A0F4ZEU4_9PEZI|nr:hypothetical protein TD95_004987 [Thielaviopsis punctulata]